MPKSVNNKRTERRRENKVRNEGSTGIPEKLKKSDCVYVDGLIEHSSHGFHKVAMDNGMESLCTSRRMENLRVGLLAGDRVVVEIPTATMNPNERIRGRIVWRYRG